MKHTIQLTLGVAVSALLLAGCSNIPGNLSPSKEPEVMEKKESDVMMEPQDKGEMKQDSKQTEADSMMKEKDSTAMMDKSGAKQISFTSEADAQALVAKGPVVYFFKANWCPTCQALQSDLDKNSSKLPATLTIVTVDYDHSAELQKKYGVTYQHTLVQIDKDGKQVTKWNGGGVETIAKNIQL